jgi:probable rRNA maturation factor
MINKLVVFFYKKIQLTKREIQEIVKSVLNDLSVELHSLQINILSDSQILELNKKYLNHDYKTDIITFNYSNELSMIDGEIFISLEDAEINAVRYDVSLRDELLRLIIHGILHLVGYDDKISRDKKKMRLKENYFLNKINNEINYSK